MNPSHANPRTVSLGARLARLYGDASPLCLERLMMLIGRYGLAGGASPAARWSERDTVLITYGDMVRAADGAPPLAALDRFVVARLGGCFSLVHVLPFFPYTSDDGFSVVHFRQVDAALGDWSHVRTLGQRVDLMMDLVLNHVSRASGWFRDYQLGVAPGRHYFVEVDPATDLSAVVRPRSLPLLTPVQTRQGPRHVWTTFSADQVDLNFAQPDVLFEMLDILLFYVSMGARIVRLDAIAYLWKRVGTPCIHLPETHEVVKLMRELLDLVAPHVILLTETNVPHAENVSYFGAGDEAHMVYQFSLPPLLLHAALAGRTEVLTEWARTQAAPPPGCTFLNFTASHDGIGVRPLEGLVPAAAITALADAVRAGGGQVSTRRLPDGSDQPYELNTTFFDALVLGDPPGGPVHQARFLATQAVMLALRGVPAVYFNSLLGAPNDQALAQATGRARSLNRTKWEAPALARLLDDPESRAARVLAGYGALLRARRACAAFHPDGAQQVHALDARVFAVERTAPDGSQRVLALANLSGDPVALTAEALADTVAGQVPSGDLLSPVRHVPAEPLDLAPYQVLWLASGIR